MRKKRKVARHLKKKPNKKILIFFIIVLALLIIILGASFYKYFKTPQKQINLGANVESASMSEDGKTAYIKLAAGSFENIAKIKFIFKDAEGKEYAYETSERAQEISVAFKKGFLEWLLGKPAFEGKYNYEIGSESVGLINFKNINEISAVFEYKTQPIPQINGTTIPLTNKTTNQTKPIIGGGGGGGGGTTTLPCTPGSWTDTTEYRCSLVGIREKKQTRTACPSGIEEQWIEDACPENYVCQDGQCIELINCTHNEDCSYLNNTCAYGICDLTTQTCQRVFNVSTDVCGASKGECDITDYCSGSSDVCIDTFNSSGTPCSLGNSSGVCNGNGDCVATEVCGNNVTETGEVCDGTDLGEETCQSQGYNEGTLACCSNCSRFYLSQCRNTIRTCTDFDGGIDYYTPSNVSEFETIEFGPNCFGIPPVGGVSLNVALDSCNGTVLSERICNLDNTTGTVIHDCSSEGKICQDGACVSLPCTPDKDCSYYYNLNQCGTGLSDGCSAILDCLTCPEGKICQGGICIKPEEFTIFIASPKSVSSFYEDDEVTFSSTVSGGTLPYAYTWKSSLDGILSSQDSFSSSELSPGMHIITLSVSDSTGKTKEESISLTINSLDTLRCEINNPTDDRHYNGNTSLIFSVNVRGGKPPYSYKWSSDKDGVFNFSQFAMKNDLSVNTHIITIEVTDSKGNIADDNIIIYIVPTGSLRADITSPTKDTFAFNTNISFSSIVSGGRTQYHYNWTSNKDGYLSRRNSFSTRTLSKNTHLITLNVTDRDSNRVADTKIIKIIDFVVADANSPINLSLYPQYRDIWFNGSAAGGTSPYTYEWRSDKDGVICNNASCFSNSLSIGEHIITFSATDKSTPALTDSKSVIVYIKAPEPLNVSIIAPLDNSSYNQGDNITFDGRVSGGAVGGERSIPYYCEWKSDIDGVLAEGPQICLGYFIENNALSEGTHTITLTAIDSANNKLSDSIKININAPLGALKPIIFIYIAIVVIVLIIIFAIIYVSIKKKRG